MKLYLRMQARGAGALLLALAWTRVPPAMASAPTAEAGVNRTVVLAGAPTAVLFTGATADDADSLTGLTYAWTPASGAGIASWSARTGSVSDPEAPAAAQVTLAAPGIYSFTLTVTDPTALVATDTVVVYALSTPSASVYDPPPAYYNAARPGGVWYTGAALKSALRTIISTGVIQRNYDLARQSLQLLDLDPNNSSNVIEIYTGTSVLKTWDSGVTWNREHCWPQSLFGNNSTIEGEEFNLRPCNPSINSSRGNSPYGIGAGYWDPDHGAPDRGVVSRAMFFVETRYSQLTLVNGQPGALQMGDLASMRGWHYQYPVAERERRRNHLIYSATDNPLYYQGNRNPYVDYPELVWAIWGTGASDAQLYVSASPPADGASTTAVDLGRVLVDSPLWPAQTVVLHKTGAVPATFAVAVSGAAAAAPLGTRQTLVGGTQAQSILVGLAGPTNTPGTISGDVTIHNTELTSAGTGLGAADGDDVIAVDGDVLAHAEASFNAGSNEDTLTIDFGAVPVGSGLHTQAVTLYNLVVLPGYTAGMALVAVAPAGDLSVLYTDIAPFTNLAAGNAAAFTATLDPNSAPGTYSATYTLAVSDEDLPGRAAGPALLLTLAAQLVPATHPGDLNCDGSVNFRDINPFVLALTNPAVWQAAYPGCPIGNGDVNGDGSVNFRDINPFVMLLTTP